MYNKMINCSNIFPRFVSSQFSLDLRAPSVILENAVVAGIKYMQIR